MVALALGLAIFLLSIFYNYVAARGVVACVRSERLRAANADLILGIVGFIALWAFVHVGWWTVAPELAGGWLGTYYGAGRR
jgi:amino acid transporter